MLRRGRHPRVSAHRPIRDAQSRAGRVAVHLRISGWASRSISEQAKRWQSLVLPWYPREDGVFLTDNPQRLIQQGKVADVPFITGECDDEGTLFSLSTLNITCAPFSSAFTDSACTNCT